MSSSDELVFVVVVIAVLASIAIPAFVNRREAAWEGAVQSDLRNAAINFETEVAANDGQYPLALPAGIRRSPEVTITLRTGASTSRIYLHGDHTGLANTIYYDSANGGVTTVAC